MAKPESISTIIARQLEQSGLAKGIKQASIEHIWSELVGPEIAVHTRVVKVQAGRVFVSVDSSVWRQELLYKKEAFIGILNRELGEEIVGDIMFTGP
jgi:predicted nucleic acid-binding Zn ribbon protein